MTADEAPRIQFVTAKDGVRIAYSVFGEGPPLVYMDGWVSHMELEWQREPSRAFFERLARGHRVVRFDGRGTGLSDRRIDDFSVRARLQDLEAIVDHLGLERFAIFAWSQSTPVAMVYAAEHPDQVSHLILFSPFCEPYLKEEQALPRALLGLIRAEWGVGARTTMGFVHPDASRQEEQESLAYLRRASSGDVAAEILEQGMFHTDVREYLPRITAPALVLHRQGDNAVPLEAGRKVASLLSNARFLPLVGDHHHPTDGDTETLLSAVDEFLGLEPAPTPAPSAPLAFSDAPVTLLFTDIEASTALTERLGDSGAQELLRDHNAIVREAVASHGGTETKHTGDGIMASFPAASGALQSAIAIQRAFARRNQQDPASPIRVRIGLNAGEPVREDEDLFGTAVQIARRICDRAEPGQILASNVVRELVAGKGFLFADQGETALRGFEDPVRLFEVRWAES